MEKLKVHLIIDYPKIENEDFSKWVSYIEKYLTYGLSQKGIEILKHTSASDKSKLVYLPVLTNQSILDETYLSKVREISSSENNSNTILLALVKDFEVVNKLGSNSDLSYMKMFIIDQDTGKEVAEKDLFNKDNFHLFLFKIYDLCSEVERSLLGEQVIENTNYKGAVYLAEASLDQQEVKEEVKRELIQRGYNVLPSKPIKGTAKEIEKTIFDYLSQCNLSVHIFGKLWNEPSENVAGLEKENKLASDYFLNKIEKRNSKQKFSRIIWLPDNIVIKDENQQKLLNKIQRDKNLYAGSEIISSSVEELKDIILEKLEKQKEDNNSGESGNNSNENNSNKNVYIVINDKNDADGKVVDDVIRFYGYNPIFASKGTHDERKSIKDCSSVLFVYQNDNITWLKSRMNELNKIKTWEYSSTFKKRGIISMTNLELPEDEMFKKIIHIKGNQSLELESFAPFFL